MSKKTDNKIKRGQLWMNRHTGHVVNILQPAAYPYLDGWEEMIPVVVFSDILAGDIHFAAETAFRGEFYVIKGQYVMPPDDDDGAPESTDFGPGPTPEEMRDAHVMTLGIPVSGKAGETFELNPMRAVMQ